MSPLSAELETMQGYPPNYPPNYGGPGKLMCFVVARGLQPAAAAQSITQIRQAGPGASSCTGSACRRGEARGSVKRTELMGMPMGIPKLPMPMGKTQQNSETRGMPKPP